jgi:4,5-DOPA dioxygenase extradiol
MEKSTESKNIIKSSKRMPLIFIGHGSPMNAIVNNEFSKTWKKIASEISKVCMPSCILCVSAHWLTSDTEVTAMDTPKTIHDFYGFPKELEQVQYTAPGSRNYAELVQKTLSDIHVKLNTTWGLDHGTWSVLKHMYPKADIPVIQLSINYGLSLQKHFDIGKKLIALRDKGVLIIGSGNIVHNLNMVNFDDSAKPYDWAIDFDNFVKKNLEMKDYNALINYKNQPSARHAHPTNDHYLPLMYVIGASDNQNPEFFCEEIVYGSLSMRCIKYN